MKIATGAGIALNLKQTSLCGGQNRSSLAES